MIVLPEFVDMTTAELAALKGVAATSWRRTIRTRPLPITGDVLIEQAGTRTYLIVTDVGGRRRAAFLVAPNRRTLTPTPIPPAPPAARFTLIGWCGPCSGFVIFASPDAVAYTCRRGHGRPSTSYIVDDDPSGDSSPAA